FDNYRGTLQSYEGIEGQWPLHLRNGRTLFYNEIYMGTFRKETAKFPISFYGIINCTVFVIMKFEDFEKVNLEGSGKHFDIILIWNIMEYKIECFVLIFLSGQFKFF
ncbi:hypothetical protein LOAG_15308, partial [Loa loa]